MELKAISELNKYRFIIPYQQRGYKWTPDNVRILLNDFKDFIDSKNQSRYFFTSNSNPHNHHIVSLVFGGTAPLLINNVQYFLLFCHRLLVDFEQQIA